MRAQNINSGALDLSDVAFVRLPSAAEGLRTRLKVNDVLVTIMGANVTVSALVAQDLQEAYVNQVWWGEVATPRSGLWCG